MPGPTHRPAPLEAPRTRLEGTTTAGGELSRQRFSRLLGVAALVKWDFSVESVAWVSDHVEVEVRQPEGEPVVFSLERRREGRPGFLAAGRINLFYQGGGLDPRLEAALRTVAPKTLSRLTIEALAGLIGSDPEAGRATEPLPTTPEGEQQGYEEQALLATWGSPAVWTSFFAVAEVARSQLDSLDFFDRCTFVQHCDLECLCVNPQVGVPLIPLVRYPWEDHIRRLDWDRRQLHASEASRVQDDRPGMVTTDLDERDVVLGQGPKLLNQALDQLKREKLGDMVFCSATCVPVVAGEDVESVIDGCREGFSVPLLYLTTTPQSMQGVFRDLLVTRRLEAEQRTQPSPRTVNLVGFPNDPATRELEELLGQSGVEVNVELLPPLSPDLIDRFPRAQLNVIHPNELWNGLYDQLQFDSRLPSISPPAPYGLRATSAWLKAVTEELGIAAPTAEIGELAQRWKGLRDEAGSHRLGFVIRARDAHLLTDPAKTWGVPLLDLVEEMGFTAVVLVHGDEDLSPQHPLRRGEGEPEESRDRSPTLALRDRGERAAREVITFTDREQLDELLGTSDLSLLYSEHVYDRRASEAGLATFSGQDLERGFEGAVRSLERLVALCRLPFFRRYGAALSRASRQRGLPHPLGLGLHAGEEDR